MKVKDVEHATIKLTDFERRYWNGMKGMKFESTGFNVKCQECLEAHDICCEYKAEALKDELGELNAPFFSQNRCDLCGKSLAGNRYEAHGISCEDDSLIHLEICVDCVMYMSFGDLPENPNEEEDS